MFTVSYEVRDEKRDEYAGLIEQLKHHLRTVAGQNYSVFQVRGKKNMFSEVYTTESLEEFDALEDKQDEKTQQLLRSVEECLEKGSTRYLTLVEVT
jgi:hypothetical protein